MFRYREYDIQNKSNQSMGTPAYKIWEFYTWLKWVNKIAISKQSESGMTKGELRGKHGKQLTIDPQVKNSIIDFINVVSWIESHYLRA